MDRFEPVGRWWGAGATNFGLQVPWTPKRSSRSSPAGTPATGAGLGRPYNDKSARGSDLTFSAPKSVSVLWAAATPRRPP